MGLHCTESWYTEPNSVEYLFSTLGVTEVKPEAKKRGRKKKEYDVMDENSISETAIEE